MTTDMSDRAHLLSTLDRKRVHILFYRSWDRCGYDVIIILQNTGHLPWTLGTECNATLTISAYNMKVIKDNRGGVRKL